MKTKITAFGFAGILSLSLLMAGLASAAEVKNYVFGSGPMGGPWRIGVGAGVQILNEQLKVSPGWIGGISLLTRGISEFSFAQW